jgi:hypothetical protein
MLLSISPGQSADYEQAKIIALSQQAWDEVEPYEYCYEAGRTKGRSVGWTEGVAAGRSEGYQDGWTNGYDQGRRSVVAQLSERREGLMCEQQYAGDLPPNRRHYLRNAISVLTEIIQYFNPEPPPSTEA